MLNYLLLSAMLLGADAPLPPGAEPAPAGESVVDESGCTPILQKFKGMQLVEAKIDPTSGLLRMVYYRKISRHSIMLFLAVREECKGSYRIVDAKLIDPEPKTCPPGSECL